MHTILLYARFSRVRPLRQEDEEIRHIYELNEVRVLSLEDDNDIIEFDDESPRSGVSSSMKSCACVTYDEDESFKYDGSSLVG